MARVYLDQVAKSFGTTQVLKDFTLEIEDQEFMVLVGPSGCGKTTVLRLIAGLEEPTAGSIYIGERMVNNVAPKDRDIAMVFQNYALYPHMNVFDNLAFGLKVRGLPRPEIEARVKSASTRLGIDHLLTRRPRELSGGQRQRVALGRAIVRQPQVFLMDEPLSNLDARLRIDMRAELARLHKELGTTIVYVTHDQVEAMTMGNRIVVMKDGVIHQVAAPREVYSRPTTAFVGGFMGSPPMNFLTCEIDSDNSLLFLGPETSIRLSDSQLALLKGQQKILVGIRPEDIYPDPAVVTKHGGTSFEATAEVIEPLGAETLVHLRLNGAALVARLGREVSLCTGDRIQLAVEPTHIHFFDRDTKQALR